MINIYNIIHDIKAARHGQNPTLKNGRTAERQQRQEPRRRGHFSEIKWHFSEI